MYAERTEDETVFLTSLFLPSVVAPISVQALLLNYVSVFDNLGIYLAACVPIIHYFIATQLIAILLKKGGDLLHVHSITNCSFVRRHLTVIKTQNYGLK
jgi:hypothetical protein